MVYRLFVATPEEPVAEWFAPYPRVEVAFVSGLYALTGVEAVAFPVGRTQCYTGRGCAGPDQRNKRGTP